MEYFLTYVLGFFFHLREIEVWRGLFGRKSRFVVCCEDGVT